jgi:hypothetical protein
MAIARGVDLLVDWNHLNLHCHGEAEHILEILGDVVGQSGKVRWQHGLRCKIVLGVRDAVPF